MVKLDTFAARALNVGGQGVRQRRREGTDGRTERESHRKKDRRMEREGGEGAERER
jgi:hypothetical protein